MDKSNVFLNIPISSEVANRFKNYIKITGMNETQALEWAINRLASQFEVDEGFPKKGIIHTGCKNACWVLGEAKNTTHNIKLYRIVKEGETTVQTINSIQVEILDI